MFDHVLGFRSKADDERRAHARWLVRDGAQDVGVLGELELGRLVARVLLDLLAVRVGDAPVGDGCREDRDIGRQGAAHGGEHLARSLDADGCHARRIAEVGWPSDERHARTEPGRGSGEGVALLAG